jgi:hypothetical protein
VQQRLVIRVDALHTLGDELMLGATGGEAGEPAGRRFVFLGDALPQACNLAVILMLLKPVYTRAREELTDPQQGCKLSDISAEII